MKKFLSLLCVLLVIAAFAVIPASAVEASQTIVDVAPGDEVEYELVLSNVDEKVVCYDFSVYFDSNVLDVSAVADFKEDYDDYDAYINPDLEGEVVGNYINIKGVDFSNGGDIVKVKFKAKDNASTHISYYIRDLCYDSSNDLKQFTKYSLTCNVFKNGTTVLENAKPELDQDSKSEDPGRFPNSPDGDSANAGQTGSASGGGGAEPAENGGGSGNSGGSGGNTSSAQGSTTPNSTNVNSPSSKIATVETIVSTDADGNEVIEVINATPSEVGGGPSPALWIVLGIIVVAGGCTAAYFIVKKKKSSDAAVTEAPDTDNDNK
ncbi:MAG: hypothetical protein IJJ15_04180 [Ruminococcus sp.]|nr:hypothetical protein [Ruminococcus sp.]